MGNINKPPDSNIASYLLQAATDMEKRHHEWYLQFEPKVEFLRYPEWVLERTTCIQKEIAKWLATGQSPEIALRWGYGHIAEEVELLGNDIRDIEEEFRKTGCRSQTLGLRPDQTQALLDQMRVMNDIAASVQHATQIWLNDHATEPGAEIVTDIFYYTGHIQRAMMIEAIDAVELSGMRIAVSRAHPSIVVGYSNLHKALSRIRMELP